MTDDAERAKDPAGESSGHDTNAPEDGHSDSPDSGNAPEGNDASAVSGNDAKGARAGSNEDNTPKRSSPSRSTSTNSQRPGFRLPQPTASPQQPTNNRSFRETRESESKREQALEEEATRLFLDLTSDPELMSQAISAAVNPNVANELARQADTAWRNIESIPGGFQALCHMHHTVQRPLWNSLMGHDVHKASTQHRSDPDEPVPNEPIKAQPMPNPWKVEPPKPAAAPAFSFPLGGFNSFGTPAYQDTLAGQLNAPQVQRNDMLSSVISRTHPGSFQTASQLIQNSSTRFSKEIEELAEMGLTDRDKCLTALEAADGDLFQALGILQSLEDLDNEEAQNQ